MIEASSRTEEIAQIQKDYPGMYRVALSIFLIVLGIAIGPTIIGWLNRTPDGYETNIYTEILSVAGTILILNYLQERREESRRETEHKERLVREAGSPIHATAINAIRNIRERGWLGRIGFKEPVIFSDEGFTKPFNDAEALLEGVDLSNADLHDVDLSCANLTGTDLRRTNLTNTDLRHANLSFTGLSTDLSNTKLSHADLSNARMTNVNLSGNFLFKVNFSRAYLADANLTGTDFFHSNLDHADLTYANLSGAEITFTSLTNAKLYGTDLSNTSLNKINLSGAVMINTNLFDTFMMEDVQLDKTTILPNGKRYSLKANFNDFGAETRTIHKEYSEWSDKHDTHIKVYTFTDGTVRRYRRGKGWLNDKDGNYIIDFESVLYSGVWINTYIYPDGRQRRWTRQVGWLDDKIGNETISIEIERSDPVFVYNNGIRRRWVYEGTKYQTGGYWLDDENGNPINA